MLGLGGAMLTQLLLLLLPACFPLLQASSPQHCRWAP
jgi:hypothetical protein